ncbi:MAG: uroporphyrinogen-III synthase [Ignavibacterium sp.]
MAYQMIGKDDNWVSIPSGKENLLKGKTIVLTRSKDQIEESVKIFTELNVNVISFPVIDFIEIENKEFDDYFLSKQKFDYLIFTSANAVKFFLKKIEKLKINLTNYNFITAVVGKKTAEVCRQNNLNVNFIPTSFNAKDLINKFSNIEINGKIFVIPKSKIGREELIDELKKNNGIVKAFNVYDTVLPSQNDIEINIKKLNENKIDWFVFTSPSTFNNFIKIMNISRRDVEIHHNVGYPKNPSEYFNDFKIAVIGTTTQKELEKYKVRIDVIPEEFTLEGIAEGILQYYQQNN